MWNMSTDAPCKIHGFVYTFSVVLFVHCHYIKDMERITVQISEVICMLRAEGADLPGPHLNRHSKGFVCCITLNCAKRKFSLVQYLNEHPSIHAKRNICICQYMSSIHVAPVSIGTDADGCACTT